jgi:hypothetical protein
LRTNSTNVRAKAWASNLPITSNTNSPLELYQLPKEIFLSC